MGAPLVEQTDASLAVAKSDEILAEQVDALRSAIAFELVAHRDRDPIAPYHLPHRRRGTDPAQQLVLFACEHQTSLVDRERPVTNAAERPRRPNEARQARRGPQAIRLRQRRSRLGNPNCRPAPNPSAKATTCERNSSIGMMTSVAMGSLSPSPSNEAANPARARYGARRDRNAWQSSAAKSSSACAEKFAAMRSARHRRDFL